MVVKTEKDNSSIIGGLFIRVLDIINYMHHKAPIDAIDAWFEIAPAGKVHLTIKCGKKKIFLKH